MQQATDNQTPTQLFMEIIHENSALIHKVCYMYADDSEHLRDLKQEVYANIWSGLDNYSGLSKMSTWIYRIALNTCITYFRRHGKHSSASQLDEQAYSVAADDDNDHAVKLRQMYKLIGQLGKIDKAIIMLWLDEHSYDEISSITGITRANVASRLHRIRLRLTEQAQE